MAHQHSCGRLRRRQRGHLPRPGRELGLAVAPAHVTLERRRAVGLPDTRGLLVEDVTPGSPGDRAGIRPGDVLVSSTVSELRSLTCLAAAIAEARDEVPLTVLRGETAIEARVTKTG